MNSSAAMPARIEAIEIANSLQSGFSLSGISEAIQAVRTQILRLAQSHVPVAIYGESGTGKELAARDIHAMSARTGQPFIAVNCGAIPENLMESEFFGVRRGAFTGATEDRAGFFQAAHGGTLFLDEIADLPLAMQVKLLRVIQEGKVRKLGSAREEVIDVRILCATHRNLAEAVQQRIFRQDLYYRLNVIELELPPLRNRREDISGLCDVLLLRLTSSLKTPVLTPAAKAALQAYDYPGNVRELENILERASAFAAGGRIDVAELKIAQAPLPLPERAASSSVGQTDTGSTVFLSLPEKLRAIERQLILQALHENRFRRARTASLLGISLRQLRYRMQCLDIHDAD